MVAVYPYDNAYQSEIDTLMNEIAMEFDLPISNGSKSTAKPLDKHWVAFNQSKIIGTVGVVRIDSSYSILKNMFVKKEFRGAGYGTAQSLIQKAYDWCLTEELSHICLGTMSQFLAAHKFYEKNGFQRVNLEELPSTFIANPIDDVFFIKKLKQ